VAYIDSMGHTRPDMDFNEALRTVLELARQNQIDDMDEAFGDDGLAEQAEWQAAAMSTVETVLEENADDLSNLFQSGAARGYPIDVVMADRADDPTEPSAAIRIVYDMAGSVPLGLDEARVYGLEGEAMRQYQSLDVVNDLIGMHSDVIVSMRGSALRH
jgi:hypothetical protein